MITDFTMLKNGPTNEIFSSNLKRCFITLCVWFIQPCREMPSHAKICKSTTLVMLYNSLSLRQRLRSHKYEGEPNKLCPQNMAKGGCHTFSASFWPSSASVLVYWATYPLFLSFFHSHPTYFAYWHHKTVFSFQPPRTCWVNGSFSHRLSLKVWLLFLLLMSCVVTALCLIWTLFSSAGSCSMMVCFWTVRMMSDDALYDGPDGWWDNDLHYTPIRASHCLFSRFKLAPPNVWL